MLSLPFYDRQSSGKGRHRPRTTLLCCIQPFVPEIFALQKHLLVSNDAFILQTCQDTHLIEGIFNFFFGKVGQLDLLKSIDLLIRESLDLKNRRIGSLTLLIDCLPNLAPISKSFRDILINIIIENVGIHSSMQTKSSRGASIQQKKITFPNLISLPLKLILLNYCIVQLTPVY